MDALTGHLDGIIRVVAASTLLGTLVAYRALRREFGGDAFTIITRWQMAGLALGLLIELGRGLS